MTCYLRLFPVGALITSLAGCSSCVDKAKPPSGKAVGAAAEEAVREFPQKRAAPRPGDIRRAAVAGSWYPGDKAKLASYLDGLLAAAPEPSASRVPVAALVAPHAGYAYSGKGAAAGYRHLQGRDIRRVVLLAVSHGVPFKGASIAAVTHYETPLGLIPLDQDAVAHLRALDLVGAVPEAHAREHSLEMQLPLLQRILPRGFSLVPILLSHMTPADHDRLAAALMEVLDPHTVVVASSDFTHRGPNYSYEVPAGDGTARQRLEAMDKASGAFILKLDRAGLLGHAAKTGSTICGLQPVAQLLTLLTKVGKKRVAGEVVSHYTSGDVTGDWTNTVTYLTAVMRGAWPSGKMAGALARARSAGAAAFPLSAAEKQTLMRLARASLNAAVKRGAYDAAPLAALELGASLKRKAGAFVTLKCKLGPDFTCTGRGHDLRGCIGSIAPTEAVAATVAQRAASAALEDPRFPKVGLGELAFIEVEVSVLTPPRPVAGPEQFQVGRHGVILRKDGHGATYLPQVAPEQGWDRETTLRHLSEKAGLGQDGWRGAKLQVYEAIVFGEGDSP